MRVKWRVACFFFELTKSLTSSSNVTRCRIAEVNRLSLGAIFRLIENLDVGKRQLADPGLGFLWGERNETGG